MILPFLIIVMWFFSLSSASAYKFQFILYSVIPTLFFMCVNLFSFANEINWISRLRIATIKEVDTYGCLNIHKSLKNVSFFVAVIILKILSQAVFSSI